MMKSTQNDEPRNTGFGKATKMTKLLTPKEAAELLGYAPATLAMWRYTGDGPEYVKSGKNVRYTPESLERWITAHTIHTSNK